MRLSSNLTIKIKLFDILFYNTLYFRELIKLIFWTHRIPPLTAAELPPSPRREGWKYGSLGWRPNGEWKYGSLGWRPDGRGGNMGLEYGRRLERSNAKNSNKRERQKREESKRAAKTEWRRGGRGRIRSGQKVIKDSKSDEKRRKSVAEVVFY